MVYDRASGFIVMSSLRLSCAYTNGAALRLNIDFIQQRSYVGAVLLFYSYVLSFCFLFIRNEWSEGAFDDFVTLL
jgi:hypothetical protein